jgi:proprotein convertase subtilisin/kexin type 5
MFENSVLECEYCVHPCTKCTSSTFCTECIGDRELNIETGECTCPETTYETGGEYCSDCNYKCQTCVDLSTKCTSCSDVNRIDDELCSCDDGYYDDGTAVCPPCAE